MTDPAETTTVIEPRKLGFVGKAIVALMVVVTAGLGVGAGVAIRAKKIEDEKADRTRTLLARVRRDLGPKSLLGAAPATNAQLHLRIRALVPYMHTGPWTEADSEFEGARDYYMSFLKGEQLNDAWNNAIYYRCPGPIHKNGWDLISCGPNGGYEEGGGDDIVVGEDLPGGIAAISSESGTTTESK